MFAEDITLRKRVRLRSYSGPNAGKSGKNAYHNNSKYGNVLRSVKLFRDRAPDIALTSRGR